MATKIHNTHPSLSALCTAHNALKKQVGPGASVHLDASESVLAAPAATDLATSLVLVNELKAIYELHRVDTGDGFAHLAADTTNTISAANATSLATAQTLANELKADYNLHRAQAGVHHNNDGGNAIASADATDQGTLNTLLNEMRTDIPAHIAATPTNCAPALRLVGV